MKWHMFCKVAKVRPMNWCTTNLGFRKSVQEVYKETCVDICQKHLDHYGNERDIFLDRIITDYETWDHHYKLESVYEWIEKIRKWSHKCYAWERSWTTVYGHHWSQHWACTWHGSVRRVTFDEVAHVLQSSKGSAYELMHNKLGFQKVHARGV